MQEVSSLSVLEQENRVLKARIAELERLVVCDTLTPVSNRRHFMALAEQEISRANRYGGPLSIFMMDLDLFKNVNDTYGHARGDEALADFGDRRREPLTAKMPSGQELVHAPFDVRRRVLCDRSI